MVNFLCPECLEVECECVVPVDLVTVPVAEEWATEGHRWELEGDHLKVFLTTAYLRERDPNADIHLNFGRVVSIRSISFWHDPNANGASALGWPQMPATLLGEVAEDEPKQIAWLDIPIATQATDSLSINAGPLMTSAETYTRSSGEWKPYEFGRARK